MKISVRARTNQKIDEVIPPQPTLMQEGEEWYVVKTKEKPIYGRAMMPSRASLPSTSWSRAQP
jgi:hypothetical protein